MSQSPDIALGRRSLYIYHLNYLETPKKIIIILKAACWINDYSSTKHNQLYFRN